jgi:Lectin C-type domain
VIEWSADCNNDGIVDYGQCRDGSLPDYNGNNIPDCCEQGAPCVVRNYPVQWRVEDGGNGHWYAMRPNNTGGGFNAVRAAAVSQGGDLASVQSATESAMIVRLLRESNSSYWLGGYQPPEAGEPIDGWAWTDGVTWSYTNWIAGEPNNTGAGEDYLAANPDGRWNDGPESAAFPLYALEWSADCNNDGVVDYGQILLGQFDDIDANGVPDACEAYEVPSEFSTIQAAIDAVPAGQYGLVLVAAGTRNESFSLNGKNIRVQGAPNNATVLDGTGLAISIARFTGGEPATAGLVSLVLRNGTTGSRIVPKSTFTVGGAVYGENSAASIRNCRFEQNEADFGGAVYLLRCDSAVEGCLFTGNEALSDGGGFFAYECTGFVRGSNFAANSCGASGSGNGGAFKTVGAKVAGGTFLLQDCSITGTISGVNGAAVHHFENSSIGVRGHLRIADTDISANSATIGAAGIRNDGPQVALVLAGTTTVCGNTPRNVEGPFLIEGAASVCGCLADLTGDGQVNGGDLGVVLASWGIAGPAGTGDANHDGVVNGSDLSIVLSNWGSCGG